MAFDLQKFARAGEFKLELCSVGIVRCKSFNNDHMSQARQRLKASDIWGRELVRWLLGEIAMRPSTSNFQDADPIEGERLTTEQLEVVTDQELESFAEGVLQKNGFLVMAPESTELKRDEGQSACDFLVRAIEHRFTEERAKIDKIIQSASRPFFENSTLDSIKKSIAASNHFEDLIKQYSGEVSLAQRVLAQTRIEPKVLTVHPMDFPKNPVFETNQILEKLTAQIQGMRPLVAQGAELVRSMNDTALRMQADYLTNAARSDTQTKNATRVAVLSLVVSAVSLFASCFFSYLSYVDGKDAAVKSNNQAIAFESLTRDLATTQHEDRLTLTRALADVKKTTLVGKK